VLHAGCVEGRAPAAIVVLRQQEIVALAVHANGDVADAGPGVEPGAKGPERAVVGRPGKPDEAERATSSRPG
jgi:hypothetical protein